jgi:preprotein translocase subunit SecG
MDRRDRDGPRSLLATEGCTTMVIVATFALLVLFSIISIVMSAGDTERSSDPQENPLFWATLGRR